MKLLVLFLLIINYCSGQVVYDFSLSSNIKMDGLYCDQDTLYAAEGWDGSRIFKITPDGKVSVFAYGLSGPIDIVRRSSGIFYVSEWTKSRISQITPDGKVSIYRQTLPGPGPMTIDLNENIYVTHNINDGSGYVSKISSDGNLSIIAQDSLLINPGGIALDETGHLFVANFNNGQIIKIDTNLTMSLFATIPVSGTWKTGYMKYSNGVLFVSSIAGNKIFQISAEGIVNTYAGNGNDGHSGGMESNVQFSNPSGIVFNDLESKLYVARSFGVANYIQIIETATSDITEAEHPLLEFKFEIYPNPIKDISKIVYTNRTEGGKVNLSIVSENGTLITQLVNSRMPKGKFEIEYIPEAHLSATTILYLHTETDRKSKIIISN